jgi:hypothetical protein
MAKIIFSRQSGTSDTYVRSLVQELDELDLELKAWSFNDLNTDQLSIFDLDDLIELDRAGSCDLETFLNTDRAVPALLLMTEAHVDKFSIDGDGLIGLDKSRGPRFHLSTLKLLLKNTQEHKSLNVNLNDLVTSSLKELQRIKKLHQALVPLREDTLKGIKITSKFAAGEASGGEFFDIVEGDKDYVLMLTHSSSYVLTSMIISHANTLRGMKDFSAQNIERVLKSMLADCEKMIRQEDIDFDLLLLRVNMKSLDCEGYNFGATTIISNNTFSIESNEYPFSMAFLDKAKISGKFVREGKYLLLSPGLRKNCQDQIGDEKLIKFVSDRLQSPAYELLNELFYQLKRGRDGAFLDFDATAILQEVDTNVIVQV